MEAERESVRDDEPSDDDVTVADEDWPVAKEYRVTAARTAQPKAETDDAGGAIVDAPAAEPERRKFPPDFGPGLAAALVGVLALAVLIPSATWLLTRDDGTTSSSPRATSSAPTDTSPAPTTGQTPTTPAAPDGVPDVTGLDLSAARSELAEAGLEVRVERVTADRPANEVLRQSPPAGSEIPDGRVVVLTVSNGQDSPGPAPTVSVPDVLGLTAGQATRALREAGLRSEIRTVRSRKPAGTVIDQQPRAAEEVDRETVVTLEVAKAPPAPPKIDVPGVVGATLAEAKSQLRAAGLRWTVTRVPSSKPAGTVLSQSPRAGAQVERGETVSLEVSSGRAQANVPDVVGLDEEAARQELQSAGFDVRVVDEPTSDPAQDGRVVGQDPAGGASADEGTTVALTVARLS